MVAYGGVAAALFLAMPQGGKIKAPSSLHHTAMPVRRKSVNGPKSPKGPQSPTTPKTPKTPRSHHYHVYVVELADQVWNLPRFRRANPDYQLGKPFVYVGMTGLDPDVRFDKHKAGIQSNRYVLEHGLRLLPSLYAMYNPMPYEAAREMEVELGIALREAGYGVWQA